MLLLVRGDIPWYQEEGFFQTNLFHSKLLVGLSQSSLLGVCIRRSVIIGVLCVVEFEIIYILG